MNESEIVHRKRLSSYAALELLRRSGSRVDDVGRREHDSLVQSDGQHPAPELFLQHRRVLLAWLRLWIQTSVDESFSLSIVKFILTHGVL